MSVAHSCISPRPTPLTDHGAGQVSEGPPEEELCDLRQRHRHLALEVQQRRAGQRDAQTLRSHRQTGTEGRLQWRRNGLGVRSVQGKVSLISVQPVSVLS